MYDAYVRQSHYILAGKDHAPQDLLHQLASSEDFGIRARVAENPGASIGTLIKLLNDEIADVRIGLTVNPAVQKTILLELAHDTNPDVRYAMAENPMLPEAVLSVLSADENPYVAIRAEKSLAVRQQECCHQLAA